MLGGGGITGAAYEMAALMSVSLATGWNPNDADVVVGTSSGSFVSALVRHESLTLDSLVLPDDERADVIERIRSHVYMKGASAPIGRWLRYGLGRSVRQPGVTMFLGSPARYSPRGIADWVVSHIGEEAGAGWPDRHTAIVAYDLQGQSRAAFGTQNAPDVGIADAVAASSAVPLIFSPHEIDGRHYVDGGVSSGTHADLVLGHAEPLDFLLVIAPMAAEIQRQRALFHEKMFDRVGIRSLTSELELVRNAWPHCQIVTLSPSPSVQNAMRPNPMDASKAVATFMRTLISMKRTLARPQTWSLLDHFLTANPLRDRAAAR